MTAEEIIALGESKPESTPVVAASTQVEEPPKATPKPAPQPFPDDWPEAAVKRVNQIHGQKIGLQTKLEQERQARVAAENRARELEQKAKSLEAELPKYQRQALDQAQARYKMVNDQAAEQLDATMRTGTYNPENLKTALGNIVAAKLSEIELERAKNSIVEPPKQETISPQRTAPQTPFQQLQAAGRTAVTEDEWNRATARFAQKHGIQWNAAPGTAEEQKKNAALQLDNSAVQLGYAVGGYDYWQHMEDGLRRAVPDDRSGSGTDHTEAGNEPPARRPVPSVAAPAARTNQAINGGARTKIVLNEADRMILARNPKLTEADIIREKQKILEAGGSID